MSAASAEIALADLPAHAGRELAVSDWIAVDQDRITRFADVTGDAQWIHVDPERAARESPHHGTVAHGFLTLALLPMIFGSCLRVRGVGTIINYGLDRVRFPAPVLAGQRIRGHLLLARCIAVDGALQAHWSTKIEIEHGVKPACIAELLTRYYAAVNATARKDPTQ